MAVWDRVMFLQLRERRGVAAVKSAEEILVLVLELIEVGTDRQTPSGHDEPPVSCPGSAGVGRQEVRKNLARQVSR